MGKENLIQEGEFEYLTFRDKRNFINNFNNDDYNNTMNIYWRLTVGQTSF